MITVIHTANAPAAMGPYSQALGYDNLIFTSGQIPLRTDGTLVEGDIVAQARQVLANVQAVLEAAGSDMAHVLKATVFLSDLGNFNTVNEIYAEAFGDHKPARSCVQVAALPRNVGIEIETIAVKK